MKISNKYRNIANIYLKFSLSKRIDEAPLSIIKIWDNHDSSRDVSEEALKEAFLKESKGFKFPIIRYNGKINAYIEGKQLMDLTITEYWISDYKNKELRKEDLYAEYDKNFIDKILK